MKYAVIIEHGPTGFGATEGAIEEHIAVLRLRGLRAPAWLTAVPPRCEVG